MIKGIAHLCLKVEDLDRAHRFYCDGLGLEEAFQFVRSGRRAGFYLKAGNHNYLEFFPTGPAAKATAPIDHLCLEVDSIDQVNARLAAAGYAVGEKKMGADHAYQAWLTDPDGTRIELHEYTSRSCQLTGEDCVLD